MSQCDECDKICYNINELKKHKEKMHDETMTFACPENGCSTSVKSKHKFIQHRSSHFKFECPKCKNRYKTKTNVKRHMLTHDKKIEKKKTCPDCEFKYNTLPQIESHMLDKHNKINYIKCTESKCDELFSKKSNMKQHVKSFHNDIRDFACEYKGCDEKFSFSSKLKRHISTIHKQEKTYECKQCDQKCSSFTNLNQHIKQRHTKERDFKCKDCPLKFLTNSKLTRHVKSCTGELNCSAGEKAIMDTLDDLKIDYVHDSCYTGLGKLRPDFVISDLEKFDTDLIIEYNGRQHYEPVEYFGGQEGFERTQRSDLQKKEFCKDQQIPILWIKYDDPLPIDWLVAAFINEHTTVIPSDDECLSD